MLTIDGGVERVFWNPPVTSGDFAAWDEIGVLRDGGTGGGGGVGWTLPAPTAYNSPGIAGQISYDAFGYFYLAYATNLWARFTGSLVWSTSGTVKPDGLPTFNSGHSLATGMLFCGVDIGDGTIVEVAEGREMAAFGVTPPVVQTANGKGIHWPGIRDTGIGYLANSDAAIRTATHLANQGTGAGWTVTATCMQLALQHQITNDSQWVFGRPAKASENQPYYNWGFAFGDNNSLIAFALNNNGTGASVGDDAGYDLGGINVFAALAVTAINTAPGVATAKFYINGTLMGTATGLIIKDSNIGGGDGEEQIMYGTVYHVDTGHNYNVVNAAVFMGTFSNRAWGDAEVASWSASPYQFLSW